MSRQAEDEYVDPQPSPARLSRRNVVALALAAAGVLLALFFGSRRSLPPPGVAGDPLTPTDLGAPGERTPVPVPWGTPERESEWPQEEPDRADPRRLRFDEALRSRSVLHVEGAPEVLPAAGSPSAPRYVLSESSVIEAALLTGIDSSRPGPVAARVVRPAYDSATLRHVLIPAGTRLVGSLERALAGEDRRVILAWTRMIFPDGTTRELAGFPALETTGEGGLREGINLHRAQILGEAALVALLGGSAALAAEHAGAAGSISAAALGLELSRAGRSMLDRRRRPTITVRAGYRFLVYVSRDMAFEEAWPG